jgi:hypothetical protein
VWLHAVEHARCGVEVRNTSGRDAGNLVARLVAARTGSAEEWWNKSLGRSFHRVAFRLRLRRGYGLPGRHLLGPLADQFRQAGDLTRTPHSVLKIGPEVTPSRRHVFFRLANVSLAWRPRSLRVLPLIFRFLT